MTIQKATDLQLAPQREALNNATNALNEAWQPNRGSELTPQIAVLDTQRDHLFAGLKLTVDAWAMHRYDADKK